MDLAGYVFEALRKDEEFILYRGQSKDVASQAAFASYCAPSTSDQADVRQEPRRSDSRSRVLVLSPVAEYPRAESLKRLEHEYSLREELDPTWVARPIAMARHWDQTVLVLEDPGGVPLDQLLGHPLDRDIPYATLAQAFQSLIRPLLSKSESELNDWRDALRKALGPNGQLMLDLVPELKLIIGAQPPVPDLPLQDAQGRFQLVFRRFIGVFARPEHPLGDLCFAAYSCVNLNTNLWESGDPLVEVQREAENGLDFAHKARFGLVIDTITTQLGLIRTLRGSTPKFGSFDDGQ